MKKNLIIGTLLFALTFLTACAGPISQNGKTIASLSIPHMHGLVYSADGKTLYIPAHDGMVQYENGKMSQTPGPRHDLMGFSPAKDAFYSSGHPDPRSKLVNPFGLIKSTDGGQTWQNLGLTGEADFHVMAVGYASKVVYVWNPAPNSKMSERGIYYTGDDGKTWGKSALKDLESDPLSLIAHPTEAGTIVVNALNGVFISRDYGDSFTVLLPETLFSSSVFDAEGKNLIAGVLEPESWKVDFVRYNLDSKSMISLGLPQLAFKDVIAYIAISPVDTNTMAVGTSKKNLFVTTDAGKTWQQLIKDGALL